MLVHPESRVYFARIRRAIKEMDECRIIIDEGADAIASGGGGAGGGEHDPTAARALFLAMHDDRVREAAKARLLVLEDTVGDALKVIERVRRGLGERYADCLDFRYIDGLSITETAERMDVSVATVKRDTNIAHDWIDSQTIEGLFT